MYHTLFFYEWQQKPDRWIYIFRMPEKGGTYISALVFCSYQRDSRAMTFVFTDNNLPQIVIHKKIRLYMRITAIPLYPVLQSGPAYR